MPMARGAGAGAGHLLLHVELIEILHRAMVQALHVGDRLVRHVPAQLAHLQGKALSARPYSPWSSRDSVDSWSRRR